MRPFRVIVVGAGMAGLAAARRLARRGVQVTVLEQGERVGGRVQSWTVGERTIDLGAQFLASPYAYTWRLFAEAGLSRAITRRARLSGIVRDGTIYPLQPDTRALLSPLLSPSERAALFRLVPPILAHWNQLDVYHPEKADALDTESFAEYITRAGDRDLLEAFFEPILSGLLYWDAERTSQAMVFLLLKASTKQPTFLTLKGGMAQLPEAVAAPLDVRCRTEVTQVSDDGAGGYLVQSRVDDEERVFAADGVVCATPAPVVPRLFRSLDVTRRSFFEAIDYSCTAVAAVGLPRPLPVPVFSLFFPRASTGRVAAITVDSNKDRARRPRGSEIVEIFASDSMARELRARDDAAAQEALWVALRETGVEAKMARDALAEPEFLRIQRWDLALPRFDVGHFHRLRAFAAGEIEHGRVVFAGDYLIGPHIEGAVVSGIRAADRLLRALRRATR